ncbi:hypothetical protein ACP4J0_35565, partial [Streptomyces sp. WG7]
MPAGEGPGSETLILKKPGPATQGQDTAGAAAARNGTGRNTPDDATPHPDSRTPLRPAAPTWETSAGSDDATRPPTDPSAGSAGTEGRRPDSASGADRPTSPPAVPSSSGDGTFRPPADPSAGGTDAAGRGPLPPPGDGGHPAQGPAEPGRGSRDARAD